MDKQQLVTYQKYIEILGIREDTSRPTIYSESVLKKVQHLEIEQKDWEHLKTVFQDCSMRGKTYLEAHNYKDAIEELMIAHSLNPFDEKNVLCLAQAHTGKWVKQRQTNDKQKGIEYAEKVLVIKPDNKVAVKIITELKNAPFLPWIPYKTWWKMGQWAVFFAILIVGYTFYNQNKEAISAYFAKMTERKSPATATFDLKKITFNAGAYELNEQARMELDKLAEYLNQNKSVKGEIACHTDNSGNPTFNKHLSKIRAKGIVEYLRNKGIENRRVSYKGYGDAEPIVPNTSEANMQKNRRVEFIIK